MAAKKSISSPASKLVASLEAKVKKLQTQIDQARTKRISDAKKSLAKITKASQKGKKGIVSLNAKLKASSASLKKAKTKAAKTSAKKRVSADKSALAKQKALVAKLATDLTSAKNILIQATKSKKDADTLAKVTTKAIKNLEKAPKKKPVKKTSTSKAKTATVKGPTKKAKVAAKPTRKKSQGKKPQEKTPSMESAPPAAKVEPVIKEVVESTPPGQTVGQPSFSQSSTIEETKPQEANPFSRNDSSLFGSED